MGNIFLTAKSGDDNKGRGLHGGQWLKVLNFGLFLVGCNMGCKGPLQYRSLLTSVATCYGARLRKYLGFTNTDSISAKMWGRVRALRLWRVEWEEADFASRLYPSLVLDNR